MGSIKGWIIKYQDELIDWTFSLDRKTTRLKFVCNASTPERPINWRMMQRYGAKCIKAEIRTL